MLWYAYGDRAPSAHATNDLPMYELALDTGYTPDQIRAMGPRDRNNLIMVNRARRMAKIQIANTRKIPASLLVDVNS